MVIYKKLKSRFPLVQELKQIAIWLMIIILVTPLNHPGDQT